MDSGKEIYKVDHNEIIARGACYTEAELNAALKESVSIILDIPGTDNLQKILADLGTTEFNSENIKRIIENNRELKDWHVGESIAEAFLVENRGCVFPWPSIRDSKNPSSSLPGTDHVGFQKTSLENDHRFAFSEVKTSGEEKWPPRVMHGKDGLKEQLMKLRDSSRLKDDLVRYLGHHATGAKWISLYTAATKRYLNESTDVSIFGIMIRDVEARAEDLSNCAQKLANGCPEKTNIELRAMYLPLKSIDTLTERMKKLK